MFKQLYDLSKKKKINILGLMSGTSADGLDIVCVEFSGKGKYPEYQVTAKDFVPYPEELSSYFKKPTELSADKISELHFNLGKWYGHTIVGLNMAFDVVANHGQTLLHQPPDYTLQIGEAQYIANICGKPVIYDFRSADVLMGGQGAPLIPLLDEFLLQDKTHLTIALNMGGIANITLLPPKHIKAPILAWDTGPANTLIDKAVIDFTAGKEHFDRCGQYADKGVTDHDLLEFLLDHDYLLRERPKSAGQEQFGIKYYNSIKQKYAPDSKEKWMNFIRTLSDLTVKSVSNDIKGIISKYDLPVRIIASGGGAENDYLMNGLKQDLPDCHISKFNLPGIGSDIKEAFGFAYLGYLFFKTFAGQYSQCDGSLK